VWVALSSEDSVATYTGMCSWHPLLQKECVVNDVCFWPHMVGTGAMACLCAESDLGVSVDRAAYCWHICGILQFDLYLR